MNDLKKAAVLFINGQSNAHAHNQTLAPEDRITEPMKNVFSLDRDPNQSFDITDVVWSGYTTAGKNLGESQDHTACLAYHFARLWQGAIDAGQALPDLYIVQISIGSQGVVNGMWNPEHEKVMVPGPLGTANIALFPWAQQVNRLVMANLRRQGLDPTVIGWHWIGSEQEVWHEVYLREDFSSRYDFFFDSMLESIGAPCTLYTYKIHFEKACEYFELPAESCDYINAQLERQCRRLGGVMVDAAQCPWWDPEGERFGIFQDTGHYLPWVQQWFARQFFDKIQKEYF